MSSVSPIIEKVQKLLALSKSSNANEAANAAGAANKLIELHRISEADLELAGKVTEPVEEDDGYIYETGKLTPWKHILMNVLVQHYGLSHYNDADFSGGRKVSRFKVFGRRDDIVVCRYMFTWLTTVCDRLVDIEAKGMGRVYISSYCEGFVAGVSSQLRLSRLEAHREATSAAIVLIDNRAVKAKEHMYMVVRGLRPTRAVSHRHTNCDAFSRGEIQGKRVNLKG